MFMYCICPYRCLYTVDISVIPYLHTYVPTQCIHRSTVHVLSCRRQLPSQEVLQRKFLGFAQQISAGMNYLGNKKFIHRDLAARNILMADEDTCKVIASCVGVVSVHLRIHTYIHL